MERLSGIIAPSLDLICTEGRSVKNIEAAEGNPSFGCITSISVFGKSKKMVPRGETSGYSLEPALGRFLPPIAKF
jgi:hypothetical protein